MPGLAPGLVRVEALRQVRGTQLAAVVLAQLPTETRRQIGQSHVLPGGDDALREPPAPCFDAVLVGVTHRCDPALTVEAHLCVPCHYTACRGVIAHFDGVDVWVAKSHAGGWGGASRFPEVSVSPSHLDRASDLTDSDPAVRRFWCRATEVSSRAFGWDYSRGLQRVKERARTRLDPGSLRGSSTSGGRPPA